MRSRLWCAVSLGLAVFLAGCGGKGVDKKIATDSEAAYRKTLDEAWVDMSAAQQSAYNWAVSNYSLEGLIEAYPAITPRKVIDTEADLYIKHHTAEIATVTANLAGDAARLESEERHLKEVTEELGKIVIQPIGLKAGIFGDATLEYVVRNGSKYDVSSVRFDAWVFVDGEERSDRKCELYGFFKREGGLASGKSLKLLATPRGMNCRSWNTLEVQKAKALSYRADIDVESVENFADKRILPELSKPTRSDYEQAIERSEEAIATAVRAKASLAGDRQAG